MQLRVMNIPGIGMNVDGGISPLANARAQQQLVIDATVAKSSSTGAAAVAGASNTNGNANCVSTCSKNLDKEVSN